jgi:hypothetical protein
VAQQVLKAPFQRQAMLQALLSLRHSMVRSLRGYACAGFDRCVAWSRTRSMPSGCGLRLTRVRATGAAQLCLPRLRWVPFCLEVCLCVRSWQAAVNVALLRWALPRFSLALRLLG